MINASRPDYSHLIHFLLLFKYFVCTFSVSQEHLDLILLILLELSQLLLFGLHKDLLKNELVLLLSLGGKRPIRALALLLVCETHSVGHRARFGGLLLGFLEE